MTKSLFKKFAYKIRNFLIDPLVQSDSKSLLPNHDIITQIQLKLAYRALAESGGAFPGISQVGFKAYSQTDEDGILLYIFSVIGTEDKTAVEICAGNGIECNTANLIINHGWNGLLVDGNEALVKEGIQFYKSNRHTYVYPPKFVHSWITRDNINEILSTNGLAGEIDLLSIDMDGMDYWIWESIKVIQPRVLVVEYQDIIGPDKAWAVPYKDSFNAYEYPTTLGMPNYCGASLPAFVKLAKTRGYRLVGCNNYGYNAFFIKNPIGEKEIPEIPAKACFKHPKVLWGMNERFPTVKDFPWVEV